MAWALLDVNIALLVWMGIGGITSAFAGPLILGSLWPGVTERGALLGMLAGFIVFGTLHAEIFNADALVSIGPNPFACATIGALASMAITAAWSRGMPKLVRIS